MPLYEYQCQACGHRFEVIQKFSDTPPSECPKCGGAVEKLLSSPAIQFKGSGFYLTDYGRGGKSDTAPGQGAQIRVRREGRQSRPRVTRARGGRPTRVRIVGGSTGETSSAKAGDSKPAAPATPKSD